MVTNPVKREGKVQILLLLKVQVRIGESLPDSDSDTEISEGQPSKLDFKSGGADRGCLCCASISPK